MTSYDGENMIEGLVQADEEKENEEPPLNFRFFARSELTPKPEIELSGLWRDCADYLE